MAKLLLVRHGQASYGQVDYDRLSPRGEAQARLLGPVLAAQRPTALFVGPLVRQQQTAQLAREAAPSLPDPVTLEGLAEYPGFDLVKAFLPRLVEESPELAQRAFHTILARWSSDEWQAEGIERVHEFAARVSAAMTRVIESARSGETICVVTSAGPIGVAVGHVFGATADLMIRASAVIRNASISELKLRTTHPDMIALVTFNSTAHLTPDLVTEY